MYSDPMSSFSPNRCYGVSRTNRWARSRKHVREARETSLEYGPCLFVMCSTAITDAAANMCSCMIIMKNRMQTQAVNCLHYLHAIITWYTAPRVLHFSAPFIRSYGRGCAHMLQD